MLALRRWVRARRAQLQPALATAIDRRRSRAKAKAFDGSAESQGRPPNPQVSVVVVVHNMAREAPRTLLSLSAGYQRHVTTQDYEVIVVDNGSTPPLDPQSVEGLTENFRFIRIDPAPPSPAHAVNRGLAAARGDIVGVMVDGARLVTPGLLHFARHGVGLHENAVVATLGWYLGYDFQRYAMRAGYDQGREDALLGNIRWPEDGYRLFEIGTLDESSTEGWFQPIAESNALFMRRALWEALGGMDERFDAPGGGFVNLDTFSRALELPNARLVLLSGEGTFHQLHGGIATNAPEEASGQWVTWAAQYAAIRGRPYRRPELLEHPTYIGILPRPALAHFVRAAVAPTRPDMVEPPLGPDFDREHWSATPLVRSADASIAAVVDLARQEFRSGRYDAAMSIARLARTHAPDELEPQRLLSVFATLDLGLPMNAESWLALGDAHRLLGETDKATSCYRTALSIATRRRAASAKDSRARS